MRRLDVYALNDPPLSPVYMGEKLLQVEDSLAHPNYPGRRPPFHTFRYSGEPFTWERASWLDWVTP